MKKVVFPAWKLDSNGNHSYVERVRDGENYKSSNTVTPIAVDVVKAEIPVLNCETDLIRFQNEQGEYLFGVSIESLREIVNYLDVVKPK